MKHLKDLEIKGLLEVFGICFIVFLISVFIIGIVLWKHGFAEYFNEHKGAASGHEVIQAQASEAAPEAASDEEPAILEKEPDESDPDVYATSHMDDDSGEMSKKPLTTDPVILSDIYAEKGTIAVFKCYEPESSGYHWEIYDSETGDWTEAEPEETTTVTDELYRQVSTLSVEAKGEQEDLPVRCRIETAGEDIVSTATLHIMPTIRKISTDEQTFKAGTYVSAREIPVKVTYQDGGTDTVTGLNGLYFLKKEESTEQSTTVSGNMTETITTVLTACDYSYLEGEKEVILRYQSKGEPMDIPLRMIGEDLAPPTIADVSISDFEISTIDQPVPVTVTITAEDDVTAYPSLMYAFLPSGEEPEEEDWIKGTATFLLDITQNGTWTAYCKDESGNIATQDQEIIAVDNRAPIVTLSLENDTWCHSNKILVNARDSLPIEYCFRCPATGEDSGWTTRNEHEIKKNGTWTVSVRDAVGNEAQQEITIDNIDNQAPVIHRIVEKTEIEGEKETDD